MDPWSASIMQAVDTVRPIVVHIAAVDRKEGNITLGTGVILDNYHVLSSGQIAGMGDEVSVRTVDGLKYGAEVLAVDPLYFVSVLRMANRIAIEPPRIAPPEAIRVGRVVLAIGYALGLHHTASHGIINAAEHTVYRPERFPVDGLIVTDAAIHPGNTGGALVDLEGRLVGLNGIPWVQGLSLALQFPVAARLANQIIEYGQATHPWLGFSGQPEVIAPTVAQLLELPADRGVVVQYLNPDGPAARAGIELMDMVVRVANQPLRHVGQMRQILSAYRPGDRVPVTVLRNGALEHVEFQVEEIPKLHQR